MQRGPLTPHQGCYANRNKGHSSNGVHPFDRHALGEFLPDPNCRGIGQHHPQCGAYRY